MCYPALVMERIDTDEEFLSKFYQALTARPLEFSSAKENPHYVAIYKDPSLRALDPCEKLTRTIKRSPNGSVQLLSGYRGSGKSTELRRLQGELRASGRYQVVLCDMSEHMDLSTKVDITDFLIVLAGALGDSLEAQAVLPDGSTLSYWPRLVKLLDSLAIDVAGAAPAPDRVNLLRQGLREDPVLREQMRDKLDGHLGPLVRSVRDYVEECRKRVQQRHGTPLVWLVDSLERMQGTFRNADEVLNSVATIFSGHADKLSFQHLHLVYTIPPYVKVLTPGLGNMYPQGGLLVIPMLKVKNRGGQDRSAAAYQLLEEVIQKRGDWRRLLGDKQELLYQIIAASGGHFRDLLRILSEVIRSVDSTPVTATVVEEAIAQIRSEYLTIPEEDLEWLDNIAETHEDSLPSQKKLADFARFLETNIVLCYQNGEPWYDVHPLVREHVRTRAKQIRARRATSR